MQPYNPFKPHIIERDNNLYAVRKLTLFGWAYYENQKAFPSDLWWTFCKRWVYVESLESAQSMLKRVNKPKVILQ